MLLSLVYHSLHAHNSPPSQDLGQAIPHTQNASWYLSVLIVADKLHRHCMIEWKNIGISWGRKWQPNPVLLPRKCHGWWSLVGYSPWVSKSQVLLSNFTSLWNHKDLGLNLNIVLYQLHDNEVVIFAVPQFPHLYMKDYNAMM